MDRWGYEVLEPDFSPVSDVIWSENDVGFVLSFTPSVVGEHLISITITNTGPQVMMPELQQQVISMLVMPPDEDAPILTTPARIVLEEPNVVWFEGSVDHRYVDSCSVTYTITDGNDGAVGLNEEGAWKVLVDFTEATASHTITTVANCGRFSMSSDTSTHKFSLKVQETMKTAMASKMQTIAVHPASVKTRVGYPLPPRTGMRTAAETTTRMKTMTTTASSIPTTCAPVRTVGSVRHPLTTTTTAATTQMRTRTRGHNDGVADIDDLCPVGRKGGWYSNRYSDWDNDGMFRP